jgi:hypothetical protein
LHSPRATSATIKFLSKLETKEIDRLLDKEVIAREEAAQAKAAKKGGDGVTIHKKKVLPREELDKLASSKPGSCKTASARAQEILKENGIDAQVHGHTRYPNLHFHTRLADGTIVDPTYTQFFEGVPADTFIGSAAEMAEHLDDMMTRFPLSNHLPPGIANSGQQLFDRLWGDTAPLR